MLRTAFNLLAAAVLSVGGLAAGALPAAQAEDPPLCGIPGAVITGTNANDVLVGTPYDDTIYGLDGNDQIDGLGGHDTIYAGDGNDVVRGEECDDTMYGGPGKDRMDGGPGNDAGFGGVPGPPDDRCSAATEAQTNC
jgi:Ca2+-binding RTX toxin-like protein